MIVSEEQMKKIEEFAIDKVKNLDYNHDEDHTLKTVKFAVYIAEKENADIEVCRVAAYLHDVGRSVQFKDHPKIGANIAKEFLESLNLPDDFIGKVCHTIEHHSSKSIQNTDLIEAKVLFDSDKLSLIGVFGFCRFFSECVAFEKMDLNQSIQKVEQTQERMFNLLQTKTGKELIKESHELMQKFYEIYKKFDKGDLE